MPDGSPSTHATGVAGRDGLRIAIVGCGRMGTERARAASGLGARVTMLADVRPEEATRLAADFPDAAVVPADGIDFDACDALFVCTPPSQRGPVEVAAISTGTPFFVEKPIAVSAASAAPVLDALRRAPVLNGVGYMNRCRPDVEALRRALARDEVMAVQCHWIGGPYAKSWWLDPAGSGGPFNEQGTHLVDLCRYVVGDIGAVAATEGSAGGARQPAETVAVALRFVNGAAGTLLHSYGGSEKFVTAAFFTAAEEFRLEGWDFRLRDASTESTTEPAVEGVKPIFLAETRRFLDAVVSGCVADVPCTFADAYATQLTVDAITRAVASGRVEHVATEPGVESLPVIDTLSASAYDSAA